MPIVMCNTLQCPYCQFCVFEDDCLPESKYEAREESEIKKETGLRCFDMPSCFQDKDDLLLETEGGVIVCSN